MKLGRFKPKFGFYGSGKLNAIISDMRAVVYQEGFTELSPTQMSDIILESYQMKVCRWGPDCKIFYFNEVMFCDRCNKVVIW